MWGKKKKQKKTQVYGRFKAPIRSASASISAVAVKPMDLDY